MPDAPQQRKIHVRLPDDLHRRLRVRCAELDTNMQEFVVELLERELTDAAVGRLIDRSRQGESSERG
jgi:plasmid stability protein